MKHFMVLGAKHEQIPLMVWARNRGYRILAVDHSDNPAGRRHCDAYFQVSYRDVDSVLDIASRCRVSGIGTIGTNDAICTVGTVNATLGLPGLYDSHDVLSRAAYKHLWRPLLEEHGFPVARGRTCRTPGELHVAAHDLGFPLLVKPGDASGCKGLQVVFQDSDLSGAFASAEAHSRYGTVVAETFLAHNSLAVESFVLDGHPHLLAVSERILPQYPNCTGIGCIVPDQLEADLRQRISELSSKAIQLLGLTYGPVHMDMVVTDDGDPYIVDIGPRCIAGPLGWAHIPTVTGFHVVGAVFEQALGRSIPKIEIKKRRGFFAHRYLTCDTAGVLKKVSLPARGPKNCRILSIKLDVRPGDPIRPVQDSGDRLGTVTAWGETFTTVSQGIESFARAVRFQVREGHPADM